jgi:hypothetical protein
MGLSTKCSISQNGLTNKLNQNKKFAQASKASKNCLDEIFILVLFVEPLI